MLIAAIRGRKMIAATALEAFYEQNKSNLTARQVRPLIYIIMAPFT